METFYDMSVYELAKELTELLEQDLYVSDVGFMDGLIEDGYLSSEDWTSIHKLPAKKDKCHLLLKTLCACDNPLKAFIKLSDLLSISHKHLVEPVIQCIERHVNGHIIETNIASIQNRHGISQCKCLQVLGQNLQQILGNDLYVSDIGLIDGLIENGYLSTADSAASKHPNKQVTQLLDRLVSTPEPFRALRKLQDLLLKNNKHLYDKMKDILNIFEAQTCITSYSEQMLESVARSASQKNCCCVFNDAIPHNINPDMFRMSTESDLNTDASPSDLDESERELYEQLVNTGGYYSGEIDSLIEKGELSNNDYIAIHCVAVIDKRSALMAKLMKRNKRHLTFAKHCDVSEKKQLSTFHLSDLDFVDNRDCISTESASYSFSTLPVPNRKSDVYLDKFYDHLNKELNNGTRHFETIRAGTDMQCFIYYMQACDNLYQGKHDDAEVQIDKMNNELKKSTNFDRCRGEVFTVMTWYCLNANKLGTMQSLLTENEQFITFFPHVWSKKAFGWFYFDYCRYYNRQLQLLNFNSHGRKYTRHDLQKEHEHLRRRAISYAEKAIEYFQQSDSSDGPIGILFCKCAIIYCLLNCGEKLDSLPIQCSEADIFRAATILKQIESQRQTSDFPPTVQTEYLQCMYMLCVRTSDYENALIYAQQCYDHSKHMEFVDGMINAENAIRKITQVAGRR